MKAADYAEDSIESWIVFWVDTGACLEHVVKSTLSDSPHKDREKITSVIERMIREGVLTATPDRSRIVVTEWMPNTAAVIRGSK